MNSIEVGNPKKITVKRCLPGDGRSDYIVYIDGEPQVIEVTLFEHYGKREPIAVIEP